MAEANALAGNYKDAYLNYKSYQEIRDSIFSQENKNKIAAVESQRAIDIKNKEIENKELQIGNQHKLVVLIGIVAWSMNPSRLNLESIRKLV